MDETLRKTLDECQQAARKGGQLAAENSRVLQKIVQKSRLEFEKLQSGIVSRQSNAIKCSVRFITFVLKLKKIVVLSLSFMTQTL